MTNYLMTDQATYPIYTRTASGDYRSAAQWSITLESLAGVESCELQDLHGKVFGHIVGGKFASTVYFYEGFVWNGTDVVPDTFENLPGSKVHDGLRRARTAARRGGDKLPVTWHQADAAYYETLKMFGDSFLRRLIKWRAVNGPLGRIYAWFSERFSKKPVSVSTAHQAAERLAERLGRASREDPAGERWGTLTDQGDSNHCWAHAGFNLLEAINLGQGWSPERVFERGVSERLVVVRDDESVTRGGLVMLVQGLPGVKATAHPHWDADLAADHLENGWSHAVIAMEGAAPRGTRSSVHAGALPEDGGGHASVLLDVREVGWWIFGRTEFLREDSYGHEPRWYPDWYFKKRNTGMILCERKND